MTDLTHFPAAPSTPAKPRSKWLFGCFAVLVLLGAVIVLILVAIAPHRPLNPSAAKPDNFVIGDLGGMKVKIPRHYAGLVEYEGDPGWGEKRQGPRPERTYDSKLISFGAYMRYPDLAGRSSPELWEDYRKSTIYETMWINVGISAGSHFGDGQFFERSMQYIEQGQFVYTKLIFKKQAKKQFGLEVHSPINADVSTRVPFKGETSDKDYFFNRTKDGKVLNYIWCSNKTHAAAPCQHNFYLPAPLKAIVVVHYRRGFLPHWQDIETKLTAHFLSFKVDLPNVPIAQ